MSASRAMRALRSHPTNAPGVRPGERADRAARWDPERLLAIVGHDLRTPLAAIRMSTALLFRGGGLTREQARTLARVNASAARMARIVRDVLDFARVRQEGRLPVSFRATDLARLARRAAAEISAAHPDREVRVDAPAHAPVHGDPDRLLQVLGNLLANAVQHGPQGTPVRLRVRNDAVAAELVVHNEGPPVPPDVRDELFEPFRRGQSGGEDGSLGLGLFIVREIVHAHGGAVEVRSTDDEGTTFTVRLSPACARRRAGPSGGSAPELESGPAEG